MPQILIGELGRTTGMFYLGFEFLSWVGRLLFGKIIKIVIYDQARVNGGSNYEYPDAGNSRASLCTYIEYLIYYSIRKQIYTLYGYIYSS